KRSSGPTERSSTQPVFSVVAKFGMTCFFTSSAAKTPPATQKAPVIRHIVPNLDIVISPSEIGPGGPQFASSFADSLHHSQELPEGRSDGIPDPSWHRSEPKSDLKCRRRAMRNSNRDLTHVIALPRRPHSLCRRIAPID